MSEERKQGAAQKETLEKQLKEWGIDLEQLKFKVKRTRQEARAELEAEIAALRSKFEDAQKRLEELRAAGDAASAELKKGVENAWAELKRGVESAKAKLH